jgi:hypothetical protein
MYLLILWGCYFLKFVNLLTVSHYVDMLMFFLSTSTKKMGVTGLLALLKVFLPDVAIGALFADKLQRLGHRR